MQKERASSQLQLSHSACELAAQLLWDLSTYVLPVLLVWPGQHVRARAACVPASLNLCISAVSTLHIPPHLPGQHLIPDSIFREPLFLLPGWIYLTCVGCGPRVSHVLIWG